MDDLHDVSARLEMSDCMALLRTQAVGRLAVVVGDHPEIFPVNYLVDHGSIVFRTAEGTKLAAVVFGGNVAFEIDGVDVESLQAWSVVVKGRAEEIRAMHERFEAAELPLYPWHTSPKPRFVRIVPIEITGRRFDAHQRTDAPDEAPRRSATE